MDIDTKIAFLTNFVPHYRESFYEKLLMNYRCILLSADTDGEPGRPALHKTVVNNHKLVEESGIQIGGLFFRYLRKAFYEIAKFDPDVIIVQGNISYLSTWFVLIWGRFKGKKNIIWASGWERISKSGFAYLIKKVAYNYFYSLADVILVYSTKGKDYIESLISNQKEIEIEVCLNGIEIDHMKETIQITNAGANRLRSSFLHRKVFLYVGGMLREKKVDLLITSFLELNKQFSDVVLWLVGDGPDLAQFEHLAAEDSNIVFFGRKVEDVDMYFAGCDFFVLPGLGGLALNQAMFWGKPCIVDEADGTEDDLVIEGFTGLRFKDGTDNSLSEILVRAYQMSFDQYDSYSKRCKKLVEEMANVNSMISIFGNAIGKKPLIH